jgi:hypothetical protein
LGDLGRIVSDIVYTVNNTTVWEDLGNTGHGSTIPEAATQYVIAEFHRQWQEYYNTFKTFCNILQWWSSFEKADHHNM